MPAGPIGSNWASGTWGLVWEAFTWAERIIPPPVPEPGSNITIGLAATLADGITYSTPRQLVNIAVITTAGTIEISLDGSTWVAMTLDSNGNFRTSAPFIRSTGGDSIVIAKAFH